VAPGLGAAADLVERARQREWLQAVGRSRGSDFWSAADRAAAWLAERGQPALELRAKIDSSRYGGARAEDDAVRRELVARLERSLPPPASTRPLRVVAIGLALFGIVIGIAFLPRGGDPRGTLRLRAADESARAGNLDRARSGWRSLWNDGSRASALAARLAWAEMASGAVGPAAVWVVRGTHGEPRDPAIGWVAGQVRESGGLTGLIAPHLPVRRLEWALLALILGTAGALALPRRRLAGVLLAGALACALIRPLEDFAAGRVARAVVQSAVRLDGTDVELEPGELVTLRAHDGARARVSAGHGVEGWVPASALQLAGLAP